MNDEETMADVEESLKHLFPDTYRPPLTYTVTRWKKVGKGELVGRWEHVGGDGGK